MFSKVLILAKYFSLPFKAPHPFQNGVITLEQWAPVLLSRLSIVTSPAARPRLVVTSQVQGHVRHRKTELQDFVTTTRWRSQQAWAMRVEEKAEIIYVVCLLKVIGYLSYRLHHLWRNKAPYHTDLLQYVLHTHTHTTPRFHNTKQATMIGEPPSLLPLHFLQGSDKMHTT